MIRRTRFTQFVLTVIALSLFSHPVYGDATRGSSISRDDAIAIVQGSVIDPSPFKESMIAYAFQDLIAPGTVVGQPGAEGSLDTLGVAADSSWFFYLDLQPAAGFTHATKMLLVNASTSVIDLNADAEWWPVVGNTGYYHSADDRGGSPDIFFQPTAASPSRGEATAPDGSAGRRASPGDPRAATGTWAVIVNPYSNATHANHHEKNRRADADRMRQAFEAMGATVTEIEGKNLSDTKKALELLPDDCSKLWVYWTGHSSSNTLWFPKTGNAYAESMSAMEFACLLAGNDADEYCVVLEVCQGSSFLDELADKGLTGFHTTSSTDGGAGMNFMDPTQLAPYSGPFTGGWYTYYLVECWDIGLTGIAAHEWAAFQVKQLVDSLVTSQDSTKWKGHVGSGHPTNAKPSGGYTAKFTGPGGTGTTGGVGGFTFPVAEACSTVCVNFRPGPNLPPNPSGSFTLFCQVGGAWQKTATYHWTLGQNTCFRTFGSPGADGVYNISMHANHLGANALITWEPGTATPETPKLVNNFNSTSIGWVDASGGEFDPGLGFGSNGFHFFPWDDGTVLDQVPAFTGPNWFLSIQTMIPIVPDPTRPFLYLGGDPAMGFAEETSLMFVAASLQDPFGGPPPPITTFDVTVSQPSLGTIGPFPADFLNDPFGRAVGAALRPVLVPIGTIFPEPLTVTVTVAGPGVVEWDAIALLPDGGTGVPAPLPPPGAARLHAAAPNPFGPSTTIRFEVDRPGPVQLTVYDVLGRRVRRLVDGLQAAGPHAVVWDGRRDRGARAASGVYFCRLEAPGITESRRLVLVR